MCFVCIVHCGDVKTVRREVPGVSSAIVEKEDLMIADETSY